MVAPSPSIVIGAVAAGSFALVGATVAGTWLSGWYDERARRALGAIRRGALGKPGFGAIHGRVRPLSADRAPLDLDHVSPGEAQALRDAVVVSASTQIRAGDGGWVDVDRTVHAAPFAIELASGEEVEVDAASLSLAGFPEMRSTPTAQEGASAREVYMHLQPGDDVWATGVLSPRPARLANAYRSSDERRRLVAPRNASVRVTRESPVPLWLGLASAHKAGAALAGVAFVVLHALAFGRLDLDILTLPHRGATIDDLTSVMPLAVAVGWGALAVFVVACLWRRRVVRARAEAGA